MHAALAPVHAALRQQDWAGARRASERLLQQSPACAPAHYAIGLTYCSEGDHARAVGSFERAYAIDGQVRWGRDLGLVYTALRRWSDAARVLEPLIDELDRDGLAAWLIAATESGATANAVRLMADRRARIAGDVPLLCEYGRLLYRAGRFGDAEQALLECVALDHDCARAHETLAALYHESDLGDAVFKHCAEVARIQPNSGSARLRLAFAYSLRGRVAESHVERLVALALGLPDREDRRMDARLRLFDEHETAATILEACRAVCRASGITAAPAIVRHRSRPRRVGPMRVGYISGEYKLTPAYYFLTPFLLNHDRAAFELFLYHSSTHEDVRTPTYRALSDCWRDVAHMNDAALLELLRRDELDALVDLSGHFPRNRLAVFPHRPAPVQATFPNYPCTTGCPGVDHFFSDEWTSPPGSEAEYSERLHRLPSGYLVYSPPPEAPALTPLPAHRTGRVTIGVFQRLSKITPTMWDLFCEVLRGAPETTMVLQNSDLDMSRDGSHTARYLSRQLSDRGVDPDRLRCVGRLSVRAHFDQVAAVDLALDTAPYNGQTTTCECLWMGVPVVTLTGPTHVSRVGAGLLTRAGLPELVTHSPEAFAQAGTRLALDVERLAAYRRTLRQQTIDTGLTNGMALAREMEEAYRHWLERA